MKILFLGLCKFSNHDDLQLLNPFSLISDCVKDSDLIIINIEGVIGISEKSLIYDGTPLLNLRKICGKIPIYINFRNDTILIDGINGINNTIQFCKKNNFLYSESGLKPFLYDNLCIFNMIDMNLITRTGCIDKLLPVNISRRFDLLILSFMKNYINMSKINIVLFKCTDLIYFTMFAKQMITIGVKIVVGYGGVHANDKNYTQYLDGLIIYDLGLLFDTSTPKYQDTHISECVLIDTLNINYKKYNITKIIKENFLI